MNSKTEPRTFRLPPGRTAALGVWPTFTVGAFLLLTFPGNSQTILNCPSVKNQTLVLRDSPYRLVCNLDLENVVVEAGVHIEAIGNFEIRVLGGVRAVGTETQPILFTSTNASTKWQGIYFNGSTADSELAYCVVENSINSGIRINEASPVLRRCEIRRNQSVNGAGVRISGSVPVTLDECKVYENTYAGRNPRGGGIHAGSPLTLIRCEVRNNSISDSVGCFSANATTYGGGIFSTTDVILDEVDIVGNSASASGGAETSAGGGVYTTGRLFARNCRFANNDASAGGCNIGDGARGYGGGIYCNSTLGLTNCIIANNSTRISHGNGGGIYAVNGDIVNCTVAHDNRPGGVFFGGNIVNSILWGNSSYQIANGPNVTFSCVQGIAAGSGNISTDPLLPPYDPEMPENVRIPCLLSPCVDAGNPAPQYQDVSSALCIPCGTSRNDMGAHGGAGGCGLPDIFITQQPASVETLVGKTAIFSVAASSSESLGYQWQFNLNNIAGATNSILVLTNVQLGQAGGYRCVITNSLVVRASVTASLAVLQYARSALHLYRLGFTTNGVFTIDPDGPGGQNPFSIYCLMSLSGGGWTKLTTPVENTVLNTDPNVEREYLYVNNATDSWYRSPPSFLVWNWSSGQDLYGTYYYSRGTGEAGFEVTPSFEHQLYGVGGSSGPFCVSKCLIYYDRFYDPANAQAEICQNVEEVLGCGCFGPYTVYVRETQAANHRFLQLTASPTTGGTLLGAGSYTNGVNASIVANPNPGYRFACWVGSGVADTNAPITTVLMTQSRLVTAVFVKTWSLTLNVEPPGSGMVAGNGTYDTGTAATISATPLTTNHFLYWQGAGIADTNAAVTSVLMDGDRVATAFFVAPDLVVTDIRAPSNAIASQPIQVSWVVTNQRNATARGPWTDSVLLSTNASGAGAVHLASFGSLGDLGPSQAVLRTQTILLPGSLPGARYLVVRTDSANQVREDDAENNNETAAGQPIYVTAPDLTPGSLSAPSIAQFGQTITVTWGVTNAGNTVAGAAWVDRLYLSTNATVAGAVALLQTRSASDVVPLNAGAGYSRTQAVTLTLNAASRAGNYYLVVVTDYANAQDESIETNNVLASSLILALPFGGLFEDFEDGLLDPRISVERAGSFSSPAGIKSTAVFGSTSAFGFGRSTCGASCFDSFRTILRIDFPEPIYVTYIAFKEMELYDNWGSSGEVFVNGEVVPDSYMGRVPSNDRRADSTYRSKFHFISNIVSSVEFRLTDITSASELFIDDLEISGLPVPNLADLQVTQVMAADDAMAGEPMEIAWVITNSGSTNVAGVWNESIFLSADAIPGNSDDQLVATFTTTNNLAAGGSAARTRSIVLPVDGPAGALRFVVQVDSSHAVFEENESNNFGIATNETFVPPNLTLVVASGQVSENAPNPATQGTVYRNGPRTNALTVELSSSDANELDVPPSVTIPIGQSSASFDINVVQDFAVDGSKTVTMTARADSFLGTHASVLVLDSDVPQLYLETANANVAEGGALLITVRREFFTNGPLVVFLSASDASQVSLPVAVTIPDGKAEVTFPIVAANNSLIEGPRMATVFANARGYLGASTSLNIIDDDVPSISLSLTVNPVSENAGALASAGIVRRATAGTIPVVIALGSSDTNIAIVPSRVTIEAGQLSTVFPIGVVSNEVVESARMVTLSAVVTATGSGQPLTGEVSTNLFVTDDALPALAVQLARDVVSEGLSPATTGTITRTGSTNEAVEVSIASNDETEATVPHSVIILPGQISATFQINSVDDGTIDGSQLVVISASAPGYAEAAAALVVSDSFLPDLQVTRIDVPAGGEAGAAFNVGYRVENKGTGPATNGFLQRVTVSPDPFLGDDFLLGEVAFPGPLTNGSYFEQTTQLRLPATPGDYWLIVTVDASNSVAEAAEYNNTAIALRPVHVEASYFATVQADPQVAPAGTPVPLQGHATIVNSISPATFKPVNIHVLVRETERILTALTDQDGNFTNTFQPLPGEAGHYEIFATHPGVSRTNVQDEFTLLGFRTVPASVSVSLPALSTITNHLLLENLSEVPLTDFSASVVGPVPNLDVQVTVPAVLPGNTNATLEYTVHSVADESFNGVVVLRVSSAVGVSVDVALQVVVSSLQPQLVARPASLLAGMLRGRQTVVEFQIRNEGGHETGPITVSLPDAPWLHLATAQPMQSLMPGAEATVSLQLLPATNLTLGEYTGALLVSSPSSTLSVPFTFRAISEATGSLIVEAVDEYTYYAEGAPKVAGARVTIREASSGTVVTNGLTDSGGRFVVQTVQENYYTVEVTSDRHTSYRSTFLLKPGVENRVLAFLSRQTVQFFFQVVPSLVEDRFRIVLQAIFETFVPIPVVIVEPSHIDLADHTNEVSQVDLKISNEGLVAAQDVRLALGTHPRWSFEPLIRDIGILPARTSLTIPVLIRRLDVGPFSPASASSEDPCDVPGAVLWSLPCGPITNNYATPVPIINASTNCGPSQRNGPVWGGGIFVAGPGGIGAIPVFLGGGPGGGGQQQPFVTPPIYPMDVDCGPCNPSTFKPVCLELGIGGTVLKSIADALEDRLKAVPFIEDVDGELSGKVKFCSCCTSNGQGWSLEGSAELGLTATFKYFLVGGEVKKSFIQNGYEVEFKSTAGCSITADVSIQGGAEASSGCEFSEPDAKGYLTATATVSLRCELAGEATLKKDGMEYLQRKAGISGRIETEVSGGFECTLREGCHGQICFGKVVIAGTIEFSFNNLNFSEELSKELRPEVCLPTNAVPTPLVLPKDWPKVDGLQHGLVKAPQPPPNQPGSPAPPVEPGVGGQGVCAQVQVQLDQTLIVTRNAFTATLGLLNAAGETPLESVYAVVDVLDAQGHPAGSKFEIRPPQLSGVSAVDGTGVVFPRSNSQASWTIIPKPEAALEGPTVYAVGGLLSYRQDGLNVVVPFQPVPITVLPSPRLKVDYFLQRDVFSDDPFTEFIEPSDPFSLGVIVENIGAGTANDVRITSAQPEIVDNQRGLLVQFDILGTEVGGRSLTPSLTVDFGMLMSGQVAVGRWLFRSSLEGFFVNYLAAFEHIDALGNSTPSILESVAIHEMIHVVRDGRSGADNLPDFLVNDMPDPLNLPDALHLSNGRTELVAAVVQGTVDRPPTTNELSVQFSVTNVPAGWLYVRVTDPSDGQFRLTGVRRADGSNLPLENFWVTDRTFIGGGLPPVREHVMHLLDYDSAGTYTLLYSATNDVTPPFSFVTPMPAQSFAQIAVNWSGQDNPGGTGITYFDVFVSTDNGPFIAWLQQTRLNGAIFNGTLGHSYSFYSVATDGAGNREPAPGTPDAHTTVTLTNTAPVLAAVPDARISEGSVYKLQVVAMDGEVPPQRLTFGLLKGPPGATIDQQSGLIMWTTGEAHGDSVNPFTVTVSDNGVPSLADSTSFTVYVTDVNSPPELPALATRAISVGDTLVITNRAMDPDIPSQHLTYSLRGGPTNASINPLTGVFRWRPGAEFASTTNFFAICVTDDGLPTLTSTQSLRVIVNDYLALAMGSAVLRTQQEGRVPFFIRSSAGVVDVSFNLDVQEGRLTNLAVHGFGERIGFATLLPLSSSRSSIRLTTQAGQELIGTEQIGELSFLTVSNRSAFVLLGVEAVAAIKTDGSFIPRVVGLPGRIVILGQEALLEGSLAPLGRRDLTLYGKPGSSYEIEYKLDLSDTNWHFGWRVPMTNLFATFEGIERFEPKVFYRAREFFANPPILQIQRESNNNFGLLLYGMPGSHYTIQGAAQVWPGPTWFTITNVFLSDSFQSIPAMPMTNRIMFFQGRQP